MELRSDRGLMPKRIEIVPHLSVSQLQAKYRAAKSPVMRSQAQMVWSLVLRRLIIHPLLIHQFRY
ncbi:MAG: hypothetical protein HC820_08385 [Hydrococcus sp. RM1_1_31]|nr:hypothetical protein [Hydrococcus sp. RM1_1_31]